MARKEKPRSPCTEVMLLGLMSNEGVEKVLEKPNGANMGVRFTLDGWVGRVVH